MPEPTAWTFDAPTGVFMNDDLSAAMRQVIEETCAALQLVHFIERFGRRKDESVTLVTVSVDETDPAEPLGECQRTPEYTVGTVPIKVLELGRAVPYYSLQSDLSVLDPENPIQHRLMEQGRLVFSACVANALRTSPLKLVPRLTKSGAPILREVLDGDLTTPRFDNWFGRLIGRFNTKPLVATRSISVADVQRASEVLGRLHPATTEFTFYTGAAGSRAIRRDRCFESWQLYTDTAKKRPYEVGRLGNITVVVSPSMFTSYRGTGQEGFLVAETGQRPVGGAVSVPFHLRAAMPTDFGRNKAVALYGIYGFCLIFTRYAKGECQVAHLCGAELPKPLRQLLREAVQAHKARVRRKRAFARYDRWVRIEAVVDSWCEWVKERAEALGDRVAARRSRAEAERENLL